MKRCLLHIFLLLVLLFGFLAFAEAKQRTIDPARWENLKKQKDFSYQNTVEFNKAKDSGSDGLSKAIDAFIRFFMSPVGKGIVWFALFLFLAFLVYKSFISNKRFFGTRKLPTSEDQTEEESLEGTNWELHFHQAVQDKDLRLTVRYSYMWLLQMLQGNNFIQYKPDKTNYDYYAELQDQEVKQLFRNLSRQYEYAWYGHYDLSREAYEEYMRRFQSLKTRMHR